MDHKFNTLGKKPVKPAKTSIKQDDLPVDFIANRHDFNQEI